MKNPVLQQVSRCVRRLTNFTASIVEERLFAFVAKADLLAQAIPALLMVCHRCDAARTVAERDFEVTIAQCQ